MRRAVSICAILAVASLAASRAWAGQATTPDGAAFSSSCAGLDIASTGHAGDALIGSPPAVNCQTATGTVGQTINTGATNSGTSNGHPFSDSASGTAGVQFTKLQTGNSGSTGSLFPAGIANGGWNEKFVLSKSGQSGQAVWIQPITVHGHLDANGLGALSTFSIENYLNHNSVQGGAGIFAAAYDQYQTLNPGDCFIGTCVAGHYGATVSSWDYENVEWTATDRGAADPLTITAIDISQDVFFAIPFTWGVGFEEGFYSQASAREGYEGAPVSDNTTDAMFQNTISWDGPGYVLDWNGTALETTHITDFTIDTSDGSGADYSRPFSPTPVPEPGSGGLLASAMVGLLAMRRRKCRVAA